jgi:5-methyltetrahydrofolate corrinoid/iron sulfur protein methyltransferase
MIIIGEKINATLGPVKPIILNRDNAALLDLARGQAEAGANFLDVNVGTGVGSQAEEVEAMKWAVETIQAEGEAPLCLDSADPAVLNAGLEANTHRPVMINSTSGEPEKLAGIVPLAAKYNTSLVALTMDEAGIPKTVDDRRRAAEKIVAALEKFGVPLDQVLFDPLVLPVSTDITYGMVTLKTIARLKADYPEAKTVLGLSNISYGLPDRSRLNVAFLHMAIAFGLDAAIIDPLDQELMAAVTTGEVLVGRDRHCRRYTRAFRKK